MDNPYIRLWQILPAGLVAELLLLIPRRFNSSVQIQHNQHICLTYVVITYAGADTGFHQGGGANFFLKASFFQATKL